MPQIVIDLSGIYGLLDKPPLELIWTVFVYGGWIPFVVILWKGFAELWLISRQNKYAPTIQYMLLAISIPRMNEQSPKAVEHMFTHLAGTFSSPNFKEKWFQGKFTPSFSFEYASIDGYTQFVVRTPVQYRDLVEASIYSQYAEAEVVEIADYTQDVPHQFPNPEWDCWGTEFVLAKPSAYPIRTFSEFEHSLSQELKDPLSSLLETLSRLKKGEQVWLQILVTPRDQDWRNESLALTDKLKGRAPKKKPTPMWQHVTEQGFSLVTAGISQVVGVGGEGEKKEVKKEENKVMNLSPGERKMLEQIEIKASKIGFGCKIRFVYVGKRTVFRKGPMISMVRGALGLFGSSDGNSLKNYGKAAPKTDYFWQRWSAEEKKTRIIKRFASRSGEGSERFVLNSEELASLWHFPQILIKAPLLKKVESRKVEPPFAIPLAPDDLPEPKG
ncbi:MAG TPA: hypothetical protein VL283_05170 [Candidatus Baltobacteraceae bacterium]|nr:hypothetical protein [Candidatus Baltobacteraceae bacterium]